MSATTTTTANATDWPKDQLERRRHALEQVELIRELLEDGVQESQRQGKVVSGSIQALRDAGIMGIMTPDDLGGNEVDPVTAFEVIEAVGRIDPSLAWTSAILLEGAGQLATHLAPEQASLVFRSRLPLHAASLRPGEAEKVDGGYVLNGRWDFTSGIHHADYVSATFWTASGSGQTERRMALVPAGQFKILDAWNVLGMKATGSTAFVVDSVFVPDEMIYDPMGIPRRVDTPLARMGMVPYILQMHPGMVLGAARRALDEIIAIAPTKRRGSRINIGASASLAESSWFQRELGELDAQLRAARALAIQANQRVHDALAGGGDVDLELLDFMQTASSFAGKTAHQVITRAFRHTGAQAIAEDGLLARLLRDINTILAHGVLGEVGFELHGEFTLGLQTLENRRMI
ncbi:alkylation response protein AidB-like acyl-CoA dehydrogenase [Arthrobacter globiformis]|uniref:acyl-CoA dehydrogenase family protein n=1 Tax=Arthrobacter globiformis TaxID=1665 RepID=UPI002786F62A|nr:acyl-CoA dehydrogenase family protein [Arthrobacter globiformis]MDQ1060833.1 alkylation response protein AidB-like acyl-CoA dehydrogenase [Arthrobacter globiformis]